MKQLAFMILMTSYGSVGSLLRGPFPGVLTYYLYAVLRPQAIWEWSLPEFQWSFVVAISAMIALVFPGVPAVAGFIRPACWPMVLLAGWITLTSLTANDTQISMYWYNEYLKIFIMYGVATLVLREIEQLLVLILTTTLALGYIAYEVNFLYLVNGYLGIHRNGYGGLDNNGAGLMLAMGVPLCFFAREAIRGWTGWGFLLMGGWIIHAVLMTYSRGAMVSMLLVAPLLFLRSREKLITVVLACGLGAAMPILAGAEIQDRFFTIKQREVDESANSRWQSWAAAVRITRDNPVFGVGTRNSNLFSYQYGADMEGRTIHNQYLQIAADNGVPGLAFYLIVIAGAWWSLQRARRLAHQLPEPDSNRILAMLNGIECSLVIFCIGALFLSLDVFELPYLLILVAYQTPAVLECKLRAADLSIEPMTAPVLRPRPTTEPTWV